MAAGAVGFEDRAGFGGGFRFGVRTSQAERQRDGCAQ